MCVLFVVRVSAFAGFCAVFLACVACYLLLRLFAVCCVMFVVCWLMLLVVVCCYTVGTCLSCLLSVSNVLIVVVLFVVW